MNKETIDNIYETFIQTAKDRFIKDGEHEPIAFGFNSKHELSIIPLRFSNASQREQEALLLKAIAKEREIEVYIYVSEAWMTHHTVKHGTPINAETLGRPSESPNKIECLFISLETQYNKDAKVFEIKRDKEEIYLVDLPMTDDTKIAMMGGQFSNLIEKKFNRN